MGSALRQLICFVFICSAALGWAGSAGALVIHDEDDSLSSIDPSKKLGWRFVGSRGSVTAIYVGNGWVLTAGHVATGDVVLDGVRYASVPDSRIRLTDPDGGAVSPDLAVFRIHPNPDLGKLEIRKSAPEAGEPVIMIGCGLDRGSPFTWRGISGFSLTSKRTKRWGTNRIDEAGRVYSTAYTSTRGFSTRFDPFDTRHEAQAVNGDSGGAVFTKRDGSWELAGVLFTISTFADQPKESSLYGNFSFAVDLSHYREQILELISVDGAAIQRKSDASRADNISPSSEAGD